MDLYLEDVDLSELIEEVRSIADPLAVEERQPRSRIDCPREIGTFHTDRTKLKQSLLNLLSNAGKFTSERRRHVAACVASPGRRFDGAVRRERHRHRHDAEQMDKLFQPSPRPMHRRPSATAEPGSGSRSPDTSASSSAERSTVTSEPGRGLHLHADHAGSCAGRDPARNLPRG